MSGERMIKAVIGVVILVVLFFTVTNWVGDYRAASDEGNEPTSKAATGTVEASATAEQNGEGEGATATSTTVNKTVVVLVDGLNFRSGASRESELIRGLDADEKLVLLGEEDGWLKVKDSEGNIGYVSASGSYTRIE